jgi:hypothetical protein
MIWEIRYATASGWNWLRPVVDLAGQEFQSGHSAAVTRVLQDADDVLDDIERRLARLGDADRASFAPLVAELRREVADAKSKYSNPIA